MTQGDPLSPTMFNVVMDAIVRHWVNGIVDEAEEKGKTGREGRHQSAVFYATTAWSYRQTPPGSRARLTPW